MAAWITDILNPEKGFGYSLLIEGFKTLGVTGFAVVGLNLWIETEDWKSYFENGIKRIVVQQDYISNLEPSTLDNMLRSVMKARFKGVVVDRENGFLDHFENNLQKYVGSPFREDIISVIRYEEQNDGKLNFIDNLEYVCRKIGGNIQDSVRYQLDPGEKLERIDISVYRPQKDGFGPKEVLFSTDSVDDEAVEKLANGISLSDYEEIDGLKVVIDAVAIQDPKSFSFWRIAHPGRNIDISVVFPHNYSISCNLFVSSVDTVSKKEGPGYHRIIYRGWVLPENGLAWQLIPSGTGAREGASSRGTEPPPAIKTSPASSGRRAAGS